MRMRMTLSLDESPKAKATSQTVLMLIQQFGQPNTNVLEGDIRKLTWEKGTKQTGAMLTEATWNRPQVLGLSFEKVDIDE